MPLSVQPLYQKKIPLISLFFFFPIFNIIKVEEENTKIQVMRGGTEHNSLSKLICTISLCLLPETAMQ